MILWAELRPLAPPNYHFHTNFDNKTEQRHNIQSYPAYRYIQWVGIVYTLWLSFQQQRHKFLLKIPFWTNISIVSRSQILNKDGGIKFKIWSIPIQFPKCRFHSSCYPLRWIIRWDISCNQFYDLIQFLIAWMVFLCVYGQVYRVRELFV